MKTTLYATLKASPNHNLPCDVIFIVTCNVPFGPISRFPETCDFLQQVGRMLLRTFSFFVLCMCVGDRSFLDKEYNGVNYGLSLTRTSGVHSQAGQLHIYSTVPLLPPNSILVMKLASSPPAAFKLGLIQLTVI